MARDRSRRTIIVLAAMAALTGACGNRVDREEPAALPSNPAQEAAPSTVTESDGSTAPGTPAPAPAPAAPGPDTSGSPQATTAATAPPAAPRSSAGTSGSRAAQPKAAAGNPSGSPASGASGSSPGREQPNAAATPGAPSAPAGGVKSPLVIGSAGTYSGPVGSVTLPAVRGAQLWVKHVNSRGGLNGHPVKLFIYDDGGDPARHRAQMQEAVERQGVVAFIQNGEALTGRAGVEYVTKKRVPVIGSDNGSPWFYDTSPMYFPQSSSTDALYYATIASAAQQVLPLGKKKAGSVVCVEAQGCGDGQKVFEAEAAKLGFDYVHSAKTSLAQPEFTAECLAARNAGVEVLLLFLDINSIGRIAASCARQQYKPIIGTTGLLISERQTEDPDLAGMVSSSMVMPWFNQGTDAMREFLSVFKAHGEGLVIGPSPVTGWVSAKLLERAARNLSEPPTSQSILDGLWSLKGEDLGGLTQPLTFVRDQPSKPYACWFNVAIKNGKWTTPDNFRRHCRT